MPDPPGITWAATTKGGNHDGRAQESPSSSEETSLTTPVARDAEGYFEAADNHGSGSDLGSDVLHTQLESSLLGRSSAASSAGSLRALSDRSFPSGENIRRALSQRSSHGQIRGRRPSHTKSTSFSSAAKRAANSEHPIYPDQSFASLQANFNRPHPPLRTSSSHPAQHLLYNDLATSKTQTAGNTPLSSPSLFQRAPSVPPESTKNQLHHLQMPKESHRAEVEHDTFTGNKLINNYEVIKELGRGEFGKVKLGRDIETGIDVAIKIVPRFSKVRRLGRLGAPEDRTKREVAILKKARHPNVVSLLEVIDDPSLHKVYLVLEFVEKGEIKWRKRGVPDIIHIMLRMYDEERKGKPPDPITMQEAHTLHETRRRAQKLEAIRREQAGVPAEHWALEYSRTEEDDRISEASRAGSVADHSVRANSGDDYGPASDLAGTMYGAYAPEDIRDRRLSMAISHFSSEFGGRELEEEDAYVPALTLEEAKRAFRDVLLGLEFLHKLNIIHRDVKPANLLVTKEGAVKISDFGVSYLGRPVETKKENEVTEQDVTALDDEKELARSVGTPAFWAPELCYEDPSIFEDGKPPKITGAIDLWALGITLFCMVYARLPFNSTEEMGLHEAICTQPVFTPSRRLVPADTQSDEPVFSGPREMNSNKRFDYDLKFEEVPHGVRDLMHRLLEKDPAKRMSIEEAKANPWVLEQLESEAKEAFLQGPLEEEKKSRILQPDEKEVSHAVVKRTLIERALDNVGRIAGNLLGRSNTRKRASSTATSASHSSESVNSPTPSNASTVGKTPGKDSRRRSLRADEVLTALRTSRENTVGHPLAQSETASPAGSEKGSYFEEERRPRGPERMVSTADSLKTIRAPQPHRPPIPETSTEQLVEGVKLRIEAFWDGTTTLGRRLTSRTRRGDRSASSSRTSSHSDLQHAEPSLALSTTSAAGTMDVPRPDQLRSPQESVWTEQLISPVEYNVPPPPRQHSIHAPESSEEAFDQAREINLRRQIQEAQARAQAEAESAELQRKESFSCPPSPDDFAFIEKQEQQMATLPSASTIASSTNISSLSQNVSNPSFGIESTASSPPVELATAADEKFEHIFAPARGEPDFMRTADTITDRSPVSVKATGKALEDRVDEDADDDDDSDDEGISMAMSSSRRS